MNPVKIAETEMDQRLLGASFERCRNLEMQLANQRDRWESDALNWQRLTRHQRDLAEWLVDRATNNGGQLVRGTIDAGLRGESYVPCSFHVTANGRRYRIELASTEYEVVEVADIG